MSQTATLILNDGTTFEGTAIGASGIAVGEVVFNTAMTGYQEILTDPSYAQQLVTLTYPHIGNTGTNQEDEESDQIWAAGLIIRDLPLIASNWRNQQSLSDYLKTNNVLGIADIDTRKLTRILRDKGAQTGVIVTGDQSVESAKQAMAQFPGLKGADLAKVVTRKDISAWQQTTWDLEQGYQEGGASQFKVVAYDFGVKRNILRMLVDRGCDLTVVPADTPFEQVMALKPDGVFLSNGPGDPEPCDYAISAIKEFIDHKLPLFGICLGHQLLAIASGAKTVKMKFGHHGANHPVKDLDSGRVLITSQNHGFAVDEDSLPANVTKTYESLFDGSLQGIELTDAPAFGFQGHPEASPGPHDPSGLFDHFIELMAANR